MHELKRWFVPLCLAALAFSLSACDLSWLGTFEGEEAHGHTHSHAHEGGPHLNVNEASEEEILEDLPDLSHDLAHAIVEGRPYASILELRDALRPHADAAAMEEVEHHLFVPVDVNKADAETLMQIPGVDADTAAHLIEARPHTDIHDFVHELEEHIGAEEAHAAEHLLTR